MRSYSVVTINVYGATQVVWLVLLTASMRMLKGILVLEVVVVRESEREFANRIVRINFSPITTRNVTQTETVKASRTLWRSHFVYYIRMIT